MEPIDTKEAPEAVGAYSQGQKTEQRIVTSGQIGIVPETGQLKNSGPRAEIRQCLENVIAVVTAGGGGINTIVKTRVFLKDLSDYDELNSVYTERFDEPLPARTVVEVNDLPGGARVEIEATAEVS